MGQSLKQYNLVLVKGRWCSAAGKVTVRAWRKVVAAYHRVYASVNLLVPPGCAVSASRFIVMGSSANTVCALVITVCAKSLSDIVVWVYYTPAARCTLDHSLWHPGTHALLDGNRVWLLRSLCRYIITLSLRFCASSFSFISNYYPNVTTQFRLSSVCLSVCL